MKEQDIQREILEWLPYAYPKAYIRKVHTGPLLVGNGIKAPNAMAGFPDIMILLKGKFIGLEVKLPGKKADAHQEVEHEFIRRAGGYVAVVTSLEEAQAAMKEAVNQQARAV